MSYKNVKKSRGLLKSRSVYVLGGECQICGYNRCNKALEFHHLNAQEKDFTISKVANRSWDSLEKELKKCILVCANCHREIHDGMINNDFLSSSFNEDKSREIRSKIEEQKYGRKYYCEKCGMELKDKQSFCPICKINISGKIQKPDRDTLKVLIRTLPFTHIAKNITYLIMQ